MIVSACDPEHVDARVLVEELSEALAAITGDSGKASFSPDYARVVRSCFCKPLAATNIVPAKAHAPAP